jgi:hypothetical protein
MRAPAVVLAAGLVLLAAAAVEASRARRAEAEWLDGTARTGAANAAALFASLTGHLRASGGDPRFADRLPADPPVIAELLADIAFVQHRERLENPRLVKFDLRSVEAVGPGLAEVRAREYWITTTQHRGEVSTRSDAVTVRYAVRRDAGTWRVADWAVADEPAGADGTGR